MIQLSQLTKTYGSTKALSQVDLHFPRGQVVGLFGENGAGKTTLMKSIFGFHAFQGIITLDGAPITHKNIATLSFATSEHTFFPRLTPAAHRDFYAQHFPTFSHKRFSGLMDFFDLPLNKPLRSFSTGQKNQFEVILALSQGADYVFMDEPFAGNDIFNREDFYKVLVGILSPQETVILSTHLIDEVADFIDRAILLQKGQVLGDKTIAQLEEEGLSLMDYIKQSYQYQANRVGQALESLTEEG